MNTAQRIKKFREKDDLAAACKRIAKLERAARLVLEDVDADDPTRTLRTRFVSGHAVESLRRALSSKGKKR